VALGEMSTEGAAAGAVPQRAGNGSARGPAVETRDPGNLGQKASRWRAKERILSREPSALRECEPANTETKTRAHS
jgi:hypothetical protein